MPSKNRKYMNQEVVDLFLSLHESHPFSAHVMSRQSSISLDTSLAKRHEFCIFVIKSILYICNQIKRNVLIAKTENYQECCGYFLVPHWASSFPCPHTNSCKFDGNRASHKVRRNVSHKFQWPPIRLLIELLAMINQVY